jgi:glutamyl/glutaminyl-tRNA synthetase
MTTAVGCKAAQTHQKGAAPVNTRFRPTPYADMHVGHAWVAWHNYDKAAGSGGRFVLIADDIIYRLQQLDIQSWPLDVAVTRYVEDLAWLGMPPDEVVYSSRNAEAHAAAAKLLSLRRPGRVTKYWAGTCVPNVAGTGASSQYNAWLVAVRVVDDYLASVDAFYRGRDLVEEMYLYDDTCRRLGYRPCGQEYLPVVRRAASKAKESKSTGACSIRALREAGYRPEWIISTLRECARRSQAAGLADVVIPDGYMTAEPVRWLKYDTYSTPRVLAANADLQGRPWRQAVMTYHRRMRARERRADCASTTEQR